MRDPSYGGSRHTIGVPYHVPYIAKQNTIIYYTIIHYTILLYYTIIHYTILYYTVPASIIEKDRDPHLETL